MSTEVIISNPLPDTLVVMSSEVKDSVTQLTSRAEITDIVSIESLDKAEDLYTAINQLSKDISANRLEITRPIDAFKKQIIAAEKEAVEPLEKARSVLGNQITDYRDELERVRKEEERKRREEAQRKAAEAQKKVDEEHAAAVAKAKEIAEEEAALFGDDAAPEVEVPEAVQVDVEQFVEPEKTVAAPISKSAVRKTTRKELEIFDEDKLLTEACASNGKIAGVTVLSIDVKAIKKLMDAGVPVAGARINEVTAVAAAGRR